MKLEATKNFRYNNRMLVAGDSFEALTRQDHRILIALKRAKKPEASLVKQDPSVDPVIAQSEQKPEAEDQVETSPSVTEETPVETVEETPAPRRRGRPRKSAE